MGERAWLGKAAVGIGTLAVSMGCCAQAARPSPSAASAPNAAMERAQRAAESPLRAILEAAKVRRRIEPDAATDAELTPRRAAPAAGTGNAVAIATPAAGPVAAAIANAAVTPAAENPIAAPARAPEPEAGVVTIRTLPERVPASPARVGAALQAGAVSPLSGAASPAPTSELPRLAAIAPAAEAAPQLVRMVEPEVSPRWIEQLTRSEVSVELLIRPDGSVTDVQVTHAIPRQMVGAIVTALEQWRFQPLAAARRHRVQLVFKPGP